MKTWNRDTILRLCTGAGSIALRHFDQPTKDYKEDDSVVTQADRGIEEFLSREFDDPGEGSRILGEETVSTRSDDYLAEALRSVGWVVDPIDGTVLYANHLEGWGISIGFMQQGVLREGVVYFPLTGEVFITDSGKVLHGTIDVSLADLDAQAASARLEPLTAPDGRFVKSGIIAVTQELTRKQGIPFDGPIYAGGSAVHPLVSLLLGRMMAYVGQLKIWDFAGALPLLLNLGAVMSLDDGTPIDGGVSEEIYYLEADDPKRFSTRGNIVVAFDEDTHSRLREALDAVAEPA
ncbi:MAG TPA: inositol monophosphatase family protein [Spirochaetia bacterium]|nr:inositol monophosphatase family protein [Spirochaetia bacterium]